MRIFPTCEAAGGWKRDERRWDTWGNFLNNIKLVDNLMRLCLQGGNSKEEARKFMKFSIKWWLQCEKWKCGKSVTENHKSHFPVYCDWVEGNEISDRILYPSLGWLWWGQCHVMQGWNPPRDAPLPQQDIYAFGGGGAVEEGFNLNKLR